MESYCRHCDHDGTALSNELEEEIRRPSLSVNLRWSGPYSYATVVNPQFPAGGKRGFYVAVSGNPPQIMKVGQTTRDFRTRFVQDARYQRWRFYLGVYPPTGVDDAIEHAIARTLMRAGHRLPEHGQPRDTLRPLGPIRVSHPLPPDLIELLATAYRATTPGPYAQPRDKRSLILNRNQLWETESWGA